MRKRLLAAPVVLAILVSTIAAVTGCFLSESGTTGNSAFNLAPNVVISSDVTRGIAPLTIPFSSSQSTDDGLIVSRLWDFGDGTISQEIAPEHTYTSTGTYTVTLTLTDDGSPPATASASVTIYVTQAPVPVIAVDRTTAESAPAVFVFDASASSDPDGEIEDYEWDFGDGSTDVVPTVAHTYSQAGTYRVILTVTDDTGVSNYDTVMVEVGIEKPQIRFLSPPSTIHNIALPTDAPLWTYIEYDVELGVPRFLRAGLDGDIDVCDALTEVYMTGSGAIAMTLDGHTDRVRDARYSPDGTSIITASDDGTLRLHDAISGDVIFSYTGNTTPLTSVAWSPDGSQFAYGVSDGRVIRRATQTGAVLATYTNHSGAVNDVAYTSDGLQLLSAGVDRRILLINLADGLVVREFSGHELSVTDIDVFGERVVSASVDGTARVW
ncbi:MAG: PKD domain-containing protein, partial [Phycisphaerae bacterium]|nr:PKD domain-containing protein [Phycisphaerae bacterium]